MRLLIIGAAAAATLFALLPASAQVVIQTPGVGVAVGDGYHRDRSYHRARVYHRERDWRRHRADCRVVKVRTRLPNGNVVIKTRRTCY